MGKHSSTRENTNPVCQWLIDEIWKLTAEAYRKQQSFSRELTVPDENIRQYGEEGHKEVLEGEHTRRCVSKSKSVPYEKAVERDGIRITCQGGEWPKE